MTLHQFLQFKIFQLIGGTLIFQEDYDAQTFHLIIKKWEDIKFYLLSLMGCQKESERVSCSVVFNSLCLGVQNEAGQRLTEFCQESSLAIANTLFK